MLRAALLAQIDAARVTGPSCTCGCAPLALAVDRASAPPDETKVSAAVDELLTSKPQLAATRPAGDAGQGVRSETQTMVSLPTYFVRERDNRH